MYEIVDKIKNEEQEEVKKNRWKYSIVRFQYIKKNVITKQTDGNAFFY